jgi:hypothetical protein
LHGPSRLVRAFPSWFDTTFFAEGLRRAEQRRARQDAAGRGAGGRAGLNRGTVPSARYRHAHAAQS